MHVTKKTVKISLAVGGALVLAKYLTRPKSLEETYPGFPAEAYKVAFKQMLNECEFGVYDDVPLTQENFDTIFKMKLELYGK